MLENPGLPLHHELAINDDDVKYPPGGSYRYLSTVTDFYAKARAANRPLQELRKISIIEAKGYCYGWHFYQAGGADLVISSDDALLGHPAFRYVGGGPRLWWWADGAPSPDLTRSCMSATTGIRIVELAELVAAEYCRKLLADFGAEVIKVERPGGSPSRAMAPIVGGAARDAVWCSPT